MFDLSGLKALVTGGSRGIGIGIAESLYKQGAILAISGTNIDSLIAAARKIREVCINCQNKSEIMVFAVDLSLENGAATLYEKVQCQMGNIDILVNNAGINSDALSLRMTDKAWNDVLHINLTVAFQLSKLCIRTMMKNNFGRIINISSVIAHMGNAGQANYAAAKAGLIGMTKSMAREFASRGITINSIAPGYIKTSMTDKMSEISRNAILAAVPSGQMGLPEDVGAGTVYLSSKEAKYVTGTILNINGGLYM
jgi:3-oxoacyl-[acyl-carrier protein] reductase